MPRIIVRNNGSESTQNDVDELHDEDLVESFQSDFGESDMDLPDDHDDL